MLVAPLGDWWCRLEAIGTLHRVTANPAAVPYVDESEVVIRTPEWDVVVWNDPVNLMSYVVWVLRKLFGYNKEDATELMLQIHNEGRSTVDSGSLERSEVKVMELHRYGLWATLEKR